MNKKRAYRNDILRTIRNGKKRFLSLAVIATLGVTMMCGLRASCEDLRYSADRFYDEQNLFDIQILSTLGLTDQDVKALEALNEVGEADGGYSETAYTRVEGMQRSILIRTLSKKGFNQPYLLKGRLPEAEGEIAVTENYEKQSGKTVGDRLQLSEETEYLKADCYTITGIIIDSLDVNSSEGSMGFRTVSSADYTGYIVPEGADNEVYSVVYVSLDGTENLNCYTDEYENTVEQVVQKIESKIKASREQARYEQVYDDAMEEWLDGKAEMEEEFADADKELADARQKIEDARQELADGQSQLAEGRQTLADSRRQLEEGRSALDTQKTETETALADAKEEIENGYAEISAGKETLAETLETLQTGQTQLDAAQQELNEQKAAADEQFAAAHLEIEQREQELQNGQAEYEAGVQQLEQQKEAAQPQIDALEAQLSDPDLSEEEKKALEDSLSQIKEPLAQAESALAASKQELDAGAESLRRGKENLAAEESAAAEKFADAQKTIDDKQAELDAGMEQYNAALLQLEESEKALDAGKAELEAQEAGAWEQIEAAYQTLGESEEKLAAGERELAANESKLQDGAKELADAEQELSDSTAEYEEEKAKAEKELADAKEDIDDIDMTKWYVQDRTSLSGYSNVKSDAASIEALGNLFPVLFLVVAVLISLTTITRMVEEERGLIGTYKALGFTDREIRRKYVIYAAAACLLGGLLGDVGGYIVIPAIIFVVFHVMYVLPEYAFRFDFVYGIGGILLFEVGIVGAAAYTCRRTLKKMPAKLMRPKSPQNGSRVFLEKIPFIWRRLTFLQKVTARNLFRYKKRLIMTVFGIAGCMTLLLCGFTIKNTVSELMPQQYENIFRYDLMAVTSDDDYAEFAESLEADGQIEKFIPVRIESVELLNADGKKESVQLYTVPEGVSLGDYICLKDQENREYELRDGDVFITRNASQLLGFGIGDNVTVQNLDLTEAQIPATQIVENYLGNMVYMTENTYEKYFGDFSPNGVLAVFSEKCADPSGYADDLARQSEILSATSTEAMEAEFSSAFALMNMVVYVILVLAAMLAFAVLFTLSTTNISERVRELATIKVLGFYDSEVHTYVNKETLILTLLGILVGMPAGYFFGRYLMGSLEFSSLEFYIVMYPQSYLFAAAITIVFALVVELITNRILDKIDMVEALKSVE